MKQHEKTNDNSQHGKIQLAIKNGKVIISGTAEESNKGAVLKAGKNVQVYHNDRLIGESVEVFPGDKIDVSPVEEVKQELIEVKISADELKAEARYVPGKRDYYLVQDASPTDLLIVEGIPQEEEIRTFTEEDILKAIKEHGVSYGIDPAVPAKLLANSKQWQIVAQGDPVQQGTNGWVELLFEGGVKAITYGEEEEKVNFRKRYEIEQVDEDDTMAIIHPPEPGKPGTKVSGQEVQPDPVNRAEVNPGKGAKLSSDSSKVIATSKGVPIYKKGRVHSLSVGTIYTHQGDVDIKSGNIDFRGHFKALGGITEGMKVSADGDVEIGGNASGAEILAGGNIVCKGNCIKCKVQAGWVDLALKNIYSTLNQMEESIDKALLASDEIARALEAKGKYSEKMEAAVVRSLLQSKFTELPEYSGSLIKTAEEVGKSIPEHLLKTVKQVASLFSDFQYSQTLGRTTLNEVKSLLDGLQDDRQNITEKADITAPYIQNSVLCCTGNIIISGQGAYNSQMKCDGEVNISRLFRGGIIEAGENVYVGEAGTPRITTEQGLIQVPYNGKIYLGAAYENIRLRLGKSEYRCEENINNVIFYLDQEDYEIKVSPWKK
ncbi:MAG: DUF342 domain-containing protein [Bacillota bacterium]